MFPSHFSLLSLLVLSPFISADDFDRNKFSTNNIIERDVLIIGGGSAGTNAAIRLVDSNKSVVLVEKESILGGHADTYIDPSSGQPVNVGVQVFHNTSYNEAYFNRLGVPLFSVPSNPTTTIDVDFNTGKIVNTTPTDPAVLGATFQKYATILATNYSYLEAGYFLPEPVPDELLIPFGEFATKYQLGPIVPIIHFNCQTGELWKEPTIYVIKLFGLALLRAITVAGLVITPNVQDLYTSAAGVLGSNVLFQSKIVSLQRSSTSVKAIVDTPNGRRLIIAKKLLMTAPPMANNLRGWDLTPVESDLFNKFNALTYYGGVIKNDRIPTLTAYGSVTPKNPFKLPSLPGLFGISINGKPGLHNIYFGANEQLSPTVAQDITVRQLDKLKSTGVITGKTEIVAFFNHTPFRLYVSVADIRRGFYKKLYALQGQRSTYFSGATFSAHDSTQVWQFNEQLIPQLLA
jgi:hypothetical protein